MHKTIKIQIAAGIIISLAIILGGSFWVISDRMDSTPIFVQTGKKSSPIFCTQEAKKCTDGSYVGRSGAKCEFAKCPSDQMEECIEEGESIGSVRPGVVVKRCCEGMEPILPPGIEGTQGICQKIKK